MKYLLRPAISVDRYSDFHQPAGVALVDLVLRAVHIDYWIALAELRLRACELAPFLELQDCGPG